MSACFSVFVLLGALLLMFWFTVFSVCLFFAFSTERECVCFICFVIVCECIFFWFCFAGYFVVDVLVYCFFCLFVFFLFLQRESVRECERVCVIERPPPGCRLLALQGIASALVRMTSSFLNMLQRL